MNLNNFIQIHDKNAAVFVIKAIRKCNFVWTGLLNIQKNRQFLNLVVIVETIWTF